MAYLTPNMLVIKCEEYMKNKKFIIEPSRRGCYKETDGVQMRIFMERQKNLDSHLKTMGIVSVRTVKEPK